MNEYIKTIMLDFKADKNSIDNVERSLLGLSLRNLISDKDIKTISKQLDEFSKKEKAIAQIQKDIVELNRLNTKESKAAAKTLEKQLKDEGVDIPDKSGKSKAADYVMGALNGVLAKFAGELKSIFNASLDRLEEMSSYAFLTDSSVRDLKWGYGLSSAEAYGVSQAQSIMGVSLEDMMMYGDPTQQQLFSNAAKKMTEFYEETMTPEFIATQLEFQTEMSMFRVDLEHNVIKFFMENQDLIIQFMELGMTFMEGTLQLLARIFEAFTVNIRSENARSRETESILNSYVSNAKNTSVNFTNNFNAANSDTSQFANMSNTIYKQTIDALERS